MDGSYTKVVRRCRVAAVVLVAAGAVGFAGCSKGESDENRVRRGKSSDPVQVELAFRPSEVSAQGPILAEITVRNVGTSPVWLNERMSFNDELTPGPLRELWIRVRRGDGTPVPTKCVGKALPARDSDYKVLLAGQSVLSTIDVSCLSLEPGTYQLVARFADVNERPPYPPPGAIPFVGKEIQSAAVDLKVD